MLIAQLGESANDLVQKWGRGSYRYGFPDQYAAEFPVRPMNWDQSRIYSGVIGRHYPNAETERYHYAYDPNMYLQPGLGSGTFATKVSAMVPPNGWYLARVRRLSSCATAPQGARVNVDCVNPSELPEGATQLALVDWEAPLESPRAWVAVGVTAVAAGIVGGLIGHTVGKRRALRQR